MALTFNVGTFEQEWKTVIAVQSHPVDPKEEKDKPRRIRFFNVSLRNGVVASTPSYPEKQAFIGRRLRELIG